MRVLTLWRPWPALILAEHPLAKRVENRGWTTDFRGWFGLHAGGRWDRTALPTAQRVGIPLDTISWDPAEHPTGIVGTAELGDVCDASIRGVGCDGCDGWSCTGQFHWRLPDARPVQRVDVKGQQGWWSVDDTLIRPVPRRRRG